jgi:hypothetical protein
MVNQREDTSTPALDCRDLLPVFGEELGLELILEGGDAIVVPYLLDERDDIYLTGGTLDPTE